MDIPVESFVVVDVVRGLGPEGDITSLQVRHKPSGWSEVRAGRSGEYPGASREEFEDILRKWATERLSARLARQAGGLSDRIAQETYSEIMRRRVNQHSEDPVAVISATLRWMADTLYSRGVLDAGDASSRIRQLAQGIEREFRGR